MEFIFHLFIYRYSMLCWISSICPIKIFLKPPLPCSESQAIDICGLYLWGLEPFVLQLGWPMGCSSRRVKGKGRKKPIFFPTSSNQSPQHLFGGSLHRATHSRFW